jgi:dihydrolipoamide dehydrogenase
VESTRVERNASGEVVVSLDDGSTVIADEVLVATGRKPRTVGIGLESVDLEAGAWLDVDDTLLVKDVGGEGEWLYATGDVNHRALLTHQGKYQGRAAGDVIVARAEGRPVDASPWGVHAATADHSAVPQVVFAEPECVSVGLTAAAAVRAGLEVRLAEVGMQSASGAGILAEDYEGRARLVVDAERGVVVGATFVGQDVAELLQAATIAIVGEVPVDRLWHAVPAFPTMSEVWLRLLEDLGRPEVAA